jgi:hypothetical protein
LRCNEFVLRYDELALRYYAFILRYNEFVLRYYVFRNIFILQVILIGFRIGQRLLYSK